jgi:hypothetical protein
MYPSKPILDQATSDRFQTLFDDGLYDEARAVLPPVNVPLLRKAVEWVEEQAALPYNGAWDQNDWARTLSTWESQKRGCGSAYCFAGYVSQTAYPEFADTSVITVNANTYKTSDIAMALLGLTDEHYLLGSRALRVPGIDRYLFQGDNSPEDIRAICEFVAGEKL